MSAEDEAPAAPSASGAAGWRFRRALRPTGDLLLMLFALGVTLLQNGGYLCFEVAA